MKGIASTALKNLQRPDLIERRAFLNGTWAARGETLSVIDPATGEHLVDVAACSLEDADAAVDAAKNAFLDWRDRLPVERGQILRAWGKLMRDNAQDLAVIMTVEQGKPLAESLGEISYAANFLDWFAAEGERAYGETIPSHLPGSRLSVQMQPLGVTVAITPWNFPSAMITRKAGAALAAGCTMIVKPAPETPLSALALAKLAEEAGMPPGYSRFSPGRRLRLLAACSNTRMCAPFPSPARRKSGGSC
ncbi:hypothetical protein GCM10010520_14260 [Rhizobium viscosum]|uniref:Acyl-CoA reductase-like NAD-dependent aldehyde dehydrogenase n=1 Tax=Rhizobium viscosum TaxID=1673 RepID=A0ABR9IY55_RHIVS|nr:acyl-CoA reductase-like NAD-dependent aldehyde dehydrogenase [Rhizobium viscosum]